MRASMHATIALGVVLVVVASLCPSCGDDDGGGTGDDAGTDVIVSASMPENGALPAAAVLDTLIELSHVELVTSACCGDTSAADYPDVVFIANDIVRTFAFVRLPDGWSGFSPADRRMIVHLHGHCGLGSKHFCAWYEPARSRGIAVAALQYWMGEDEWNGGNPRPNESYAYYVTGPGETCGWHLDIDGDIHPFVDALAAHYGARSMMLHGFSMAAATSAIVDYRDKNDWDRIDLTVFDAGHIAEDHDFRREIESSADPAAFANERFFFFLEGMDAAVYAQQCSTRTFLLANGAEDVQTVIAEGGAYRHGALQNHEDFAPVRERIVAVYDSLASAAAGTGGRGGAARAPARRRGSSVSGPAGFRPDGG